MGLIQLINDLIIQFNPALQLMSSLTLTHTTVCQCQCLCQLTQKAARLVIEKYLLITPCFRHTQSIKPILPLSIDAHRYDDYWLLGSCINSVDLRYICPVKQLVDDDKFRSCDTWVCVGSDSVSSFDLWPKWFDLTWQPSTKSLHISINMPSLSTFDEFLW